MTPLELQEMFAAFKKRRDFQNSETWIDEVHDFVWADEDS